MASSKKAAGIAVLKDDSGNMKGRIITEDERQMLLSQFGDDFQTPTTTGSNYTIGKDMKSDVGIGFRQLPGEAIFGVILKEPANNCNLVVYADKEPSEFQPMLDALGGVQTFTEDIVQYGNGYAASYPGGSGMWEMTCLPPNK